MGNEKHAGDLLDRSSVTDFFLSVLSAKLVWQGFWRTDRAPVVNLGRIATLWSYAYGGSGRLRSAGFGLGVFGRAGIVKRHFVEKAPGVTELASYAPGLMRLGER